MSRSQNPADGPVVTLVDSTRFPYDLSIASARTCYSSKGIIWPEDVRATEQARALRDRIAASTMAAGHLTTRQHPHFIFAIDRISRHLIWSFLHSHPYYNSEQVSQRYVEVKRDRFHTPPSLRRSEKLTALYEEVMNESMDAYARLIELLEPKASQIYFGIFRARERKKENYKSVIKKKCMEAARYVLPVATHAYLYHTINGLTLHRYRKLAAACDVPEESRQLIDAMFHAVEQADPDYAKEMHDPADIEDTLEYRFFTEFYSDGKNARASSERFIREYDEGLSGYTSKLTGYHKEAGSVLAGAVRAVTGISSDELTDDEAIDLAMNPARNHHLGSTLNETTLSRITRALWHVQYTFQKKISHTADSQDQRHRMVPGSRPVLMKHFTGRPDYITPELISQSPQADEYYRKFMESLFSKIAQAISEGATGEEAVYMLPNAFPVRFYESGDLLNLHHKWKARTCYNAQEEIFKASVEELSQVLEVHPWIQQNIMAPCKLRKDAGQKPYCPEGDRYCGIPVWNQTLDQYKRVL